MKIINNIFISLIACVLVLSVMSMAYTMPPLTVLGNLTLDNGALPSKITGGVDNSDNLYLTSTSAATKGKIYFGTNSVFDEVNRRLGIGTTLPSVPLHVVGNAEIGGISYLDNYVRLDKLGTALLPTITGFSDTNTGVYFPYSDILAFSTGGTERLNLSSSGVSSPLPLMLGAVGTPTAPAGSDIKIYASSGQLWYINATGSYVVSGGATTGGTGDVVGPASSTADNIPTFASTSGKTLKDGGTKISELLLKTGGIMSGSIAMSANNITGLRNGSSSQDAVTYSQLISNSMKGYATVGPSSTCTYSTDGINDAAQVVQAFTAGHKTVFVVGQLYITPGYPIYFTANGQSLVGSGWGSQSQLILSGTAAGSLITLNRTDCQVYNLMLTGNRSTQTGSYGINWIAGYENIIEKCWIGGTGSDAIRISVGSSLMASMITKCFLSNMHGHGINIMSGAGDLRIIDNEIGNATGNEILNSGGTIQMSDNHLWTTFAANGGALVFCNGASSNTMVGNYLDSPNWVAIDIARGSEYNVIMGNFGRNPLRSGAKWIIINSSMNSIVGNCLADAPSTVTTAIEVKAGSWNNNIVGNAMAGDAILDNGGSTIFASVGTNPGSNK